MTDTSSHDKYPDLSHLIDPACFQSLVPTHKQILVPNSESVGQYDLNTLFEKKLYVEACEKARRDLIAVSDPRDSEKIFALWRVRMLSLVLAELVPIARVESKVFGDLGAERYRLEGGTCIVPWEFRLYMGPIQSGGENQNCLARYYTLAKEARVEAVRAASPDLNVESLGGLYASQEEWNSRLRDLGLQVARTLMAMKEMTTAIDHLASLFSTEVARNGPDSMYAKRTSVLLAVVYLQIGDTISAREWIQRAPEDYSKSMIQALCSIADGDWEESGRALEEKWSTADGLFTPENTVIANNLAISKLQQGKLQEPLDLLGELLDNGFVAPTLLFNLFTMHDLRYDGTETLRTRLLESCHTHNIESLGTFNFK